MTEGTRLYKPGPSRRLVLAVIAACLASATFIAPVLVSAAVGLPAGFTDSLVASGFAGRLTAMTFGPDGRLYVSEKQGSVRIVENGNLLTTPFLAITANTDSERGLKSIAFDPDYAANGFVYAYYTDPATLKNKVSRFTRMAGNPDRLDPATELVLVDGINSGIYHSGGGVAFGPDGKLYVSTGDASYAPSAQGLGNLDGKILRINRDGTVPSDNPFVGQAGRRPQIWAYGLRNPFTFAFAEDGRLFINDVGNATWEEVNVGARGANYGWPTCEGACNDSRFVDPIYAYRHDAGPGKSITGGVFYGGTMFPAEYRGDYFFGDYVGEHIRRYDAATGQVSDFATSVANPVDIEVGPDGALYYLSVEAKTVHRIAYGEPPPPPPPPDPNNLVVNGGFEATGAGWLTPWWPVVRSPAQATVVRSTSSRASGAAAFQANIAQPSLDWHVQLLQPRIPLTSGRTHVLEFWARATAARSIRVTFQQNSGTYRTYFERSFAISTDWQRHSVSFNATTDDPAALLAINVGAAGGQVLLDDVRLSLSSNIGRPPSATITAPAVGTRYRATDVITYSGSASDPEDGTLAPARLTWEVVFHHDTHTHPYVEPVSGRSTGTFTIPDTGETSTNVWFRIHLTATDSDGNTAEVTRDILPTTTAVTLATAPAGLSLSLNGTPVSGPHQFQSVVRFQNELAAPPTQLVNGTTYRFVSWSDGGAATHTIVTPAGNPTYTAHYEPETTNLLRNGSFDVTGTGWRDPWRLNVRSPATATVLRETIGAPSAPAALRVDMSAAAQDWHVQLAQPGLSIVSGTQHRISFRARATGSRTIRIAVQRNGGTYPLYAERRFTIGTTWQLYTATFSPGVTDPAALFSINFGTAAGSIWIDDVSVTR